MSASSSDHEENREKTPGPKPHTHSFFSPEAAAGRGIYLKIFIGGTFLMIICIFAIFAIYWGALWKTPARPLPGWIVDFDGGQVGAAITQGLTSPEMTAAGGSRISWTIKPASDFPNGAAGVSEKVLDEKVWIALTINTEATTRLRSSLTTPNPAYDPTAAITVFAVEARSENGFRSLLRPTVQQELGIITNRFALETVKNLLTTPANVTNILATSPQTLLQPVSYQLNNIRPFDVPLASAVTFVGLIYLLILSFFLVMISLNAREISGLHRILTTRSTILLRLGSSFLGYFVLSLFYSLLSVAFKLPLDRVFGHAGFMVFWMLNWIGMLAVGLALESMITILTVRGVPFFMMLWIISNVSVCFMPIEVLPSVFKYGYASPFYAVNKAVRTIVFDTKNSLGLDFGILIAWIVISCLTLPLFQIIVDRRERKQAST